MSSLSAARLTIDLDALAHNYRVLEAEAGGARVAPVVKADGYGLGAGPVARRLWREGARTFFVAHLSEGQALRRALGPERPATIHVLDGLTDGSAPAMAADGLTPVLCTDAQVRAAASLPSPLPVALHVDTGMNRQGLTLAQAEALDDDLLARLRIGLVMSHLGCAASPDHPRNRAQLERFQRIRARFAEVPASLAASAGVYLGADYHFDLVRPGVSLYGGGPREVPDLRFRAVATLQAPIVDIRQVEAGDAVGYGASVVLETRTRLAVVGAGYADGVIRGSKGAGYAWVAGARRRLVIVNMNILAIDLDDAEVSVGDAVELLGDNARLDDLALAAGSVAHEWLVRISHRAERVYLGGD